MIRDTFDFAMEAMVEGLGDEVAYSRVFEDPVKPRAVFGSGFTRLQSGDIRLSSRRPELMVRLDDFPFPMDAEHARGDRVTVRGTEMEVVNSQPDVEGVGATLTLKVVPD